MSGVMMISSGSYADIARGIPFGRQIRVTSLPCPPAAWSARLTSKILWYSGVSGACWPRPYGLLGSCGGWPTAPGTGARRHWPFQSGYLVSSQAMAPETETTSATASASAPIELPCDMIVLQ